MAILKITDNTGDDVQELLCKRSVMVTCVFFQMEKNTECKVIVILQRVLQLIPGHHSLIPVHTQLSCVLFCVCLYMIENHPSFL